MIIKRNWATPGFTCLAMLALSACAGNGASTGGASGGTGGTGGGAGGGGVVVDFTVPNAYADFGDETAKKIGTLTVFGDSYSAEDAVNNRDFDTWAERMVDDADNATLDSYARGSASANDTNVYDGGDNTFETQTNQWLAGGPAFQDNDLTVVYMGYNDVNKLWRDADLQAALADYETELGRILTAGAGDDGRKVFLTLIHDWDSIPKELDRIARDQAPGGLCDRNGLSDDECRYKRQRTIQWNERLIEMANAHDNVVAVDLFTVVDRVLADPARFGFIDVTSVGGANAVADDATHLYFDSVHFGGHGQEIIAQVMNHYLTRGWDWANTLAAGSAATTRLGEDLENGLVLGLAALPEEQRLGLNSFVIGDGAFRPAAEGSGARASFEAMQGEASKDAGFGLNYAFSDDTMMGVAISNYRDEGSFGSDARNSRLAYEGTGVSFYFNTEASGVQLRTVASFIDDHHRRTDHDGLVGAANSATFGGETMSISQTASLPFQVGSSWLTPWAGLSHTVQQLDSYTISNPYLSDTTFEGDAISETYATIGLSGQSGTIMVGDESALSFTGRVSYSRSLQLDDYRVSVREAALGYAEQETIRRDDQGIFGLRLGAELAVDEQLSLSAGYAIDKQSDAEAEQSVQMRLNYRF